MMKLRPFLYGILASLFFSFAFIMNRAMELTGGYWMWSASLRYLFMLPLLVLLVIFRGGIMPVLKELKSQPGRWLIWSTVGFGLFYVPLCYAAAFGPGWLIASTWQITIVAGVLLTPWLGRSDSAKLPVRSLMVSMIILAGVLLMQIEHADRITARELLAGAIPVVIAAFAYPLGNRKMMSFVSGRLNVYQRVLGMTIASLPVWLLLAAAASAVHGPPSMEQTSQAAIVALSSGVVATILFFSATELVKHSPQRLAAVEATQAGEVVFTVFGELILLKSPHPSILSWIGMAVVVAGMIIHSLIASRTSAVKRKAIQLGMGK